MKIFLLFLQISFTNCIVYLRPWNDKGPEAVKSGIECIGKVERIYFDSSLSNQTPNLAIFHTKNLSSPSMEIEVQYLFELHDRVLHQEEDEKSFQLKIISDDVSVDMKNSILDVTLTGFYIIIIDDVEKLSKNLKLISLTKSFNEEAKYLILYNNIEKRDGGKELACKFMNMLFKQYRAINVVVMFANDAFSYEIYTGNPYGIYGESCKKNTLESSTCGSMRIINVGICSRGQLSDIKQINKWLKMDKIPDKMADDCLFRFCARVQEPFIDGDCDEGLEIQIMNFLQNEMGFKLTTTCMNMDRGEPIGNGSWSHLLGKVRGDTCDIIAGGFFPDHDVHAAFASTDYYLENHYTFFVPKASIEPRWKGLITIFTPNLWYATLSVFIISWIFWFMLGNTTDEAPQHRNFTIVFLHVLAVTFGVSVHSHPILNPLRVFFAILAIYSLILSTLYTSQLINVFTHPKLGHQINSIEELLKTDLLIGGRSENLDWFDNDDEIDRKIYEKYNFSKAFRPSMETLEKISNYEMALVISKSYVRQTEYRDKVFGFSSSLFSSQLEMLCERGFPLLKRINKILGIFSDSGIGSKLRNDFKFNSTVLIAIRELVKVLKSSEDFSQEAMDQLNDITEGEDEEDEESGPNPLKPEQLMGAITLLILGLIIGLVIFSIEHITNTKFFKDILKKVKKFFECHKIKKVVKKYFERFFKKFNFKFPKFKFPHLNFLKIFNKKKTTKEEIKLLKRRVRKFAYRPIRFTPIGERVPLNGKKKIV